MNQVIILILIYNHIHILVITATTTSSLNNELHPFNNPDDGPRAGAFTPDLMNNDDIKTFPEWTKLLIVINN